MLVRIKILQTEQLGKEEVTQEGRGAILVERSFGTPLWRDSDASVRCLDIFRVELGTPMNVCHTPATFQQLAGSTLPGRSFREGWYLPPLPVVKCPSGAIIVE